MAPVIVDGAGARVRDADGNWFVEYGSGMRAVTLGHGYEPVVAAVRAAIGGGVGFSRPTTMGNGPRAARAGRVRLPRAAPARAQPAACAQPFFSGQDCCVGTLPLAAGVPAAV